MLAVLDDALGCLQHQRFAKDLRGRRLFREAHEWIESRERDWPFAFERICETLGIDAAHLRDELRYRRLYGHQLHESHAMMER